MTFHYLSNRLSKVAYKTNGLPFDAFSTRVQRERVVIFWSGRGARIVRESSIDNDNNNLFVYLFHRKTRVTTKGVTTGKESYVESETSTHVVPFS